MTKPTVRTIARQQGIDLPKLISILEHRRPAGDPVEEDFVIEYLDSIEGMQKDDFGNRYIRVGEARVMWSCHTDTVSDEGGKQNLKWQGDVLSLNQGKRGQSLGADDGAGMWLMLEMLKAGKEGLYIFHREEEVGGVGSRWISAKTPELVDNIDYAVAFDRKATHSVITYQRGRRCCSDAFGRALAAELNQVPGMGYKLDEGGVFTDTANYTDLIPECTNLSVGYYDEHSEDETLDVAHLFKLREALLDLDITKLPVERDPSKVEHRSYGGYGGYYGSSYTSWWDRQEQKKSQNTPLMEMADLVEEKIYSVSRWLIGMGMTPELLNKLLQNTWGQGLHPKPALSLVDNHQRDVVDNLAARGITDPDDELELEDEVEQGTALWCNTCGDWDEDSFNLNLDSGDPCGVCHSHDTSACDVDVNLETGEIVYA